MLVKRLDVVLGALSFAALLPAVACTGQLGTVLEEPDEDDGQFGGAGGASAPKPPTDRPPGRDGEPGGPSACGKGPSAGPMPIRRLTRKEYDHTVRDLLGVTQSPSLGFTDDEIVAGFAANALAPVDRLQVEDYRAAASTLAEAATSDVRRLTSCSDADLPCLQGFLRKFAPRAWRRPLTETESRRYEKLMSDSAAAWGPVTGLRLAIQALLQSPNFLYHVPQTRKEASGDVARLDDATLAARLSYLIWQTLPDEELTKAAAEGVLSTPEGLTKQVERMLTSPRAHDGLRTFHLQWLGLESLRQSTKDPELFPDWSPELAQAMVEDVEAAVSAVFAADGGKLSTLMTMPDAFGDAPALKRVYGVTGTKGAFSPPPGERAGLLTRPAVLARYAHAAEGSWTERGKFVRERMLCQTIPAPPPTVVIDEPGNDPSRLKDPLCSSCHRLMDPLGQGFDRYDAVGALSRDAGASGKGALWDAPTEALEGEFDGPVDLAKKLGDSPHVMSCMVRQWFRFAVKRLEQQNDACALEKLEAQFAASGGVTTSLIAALAASDAFAFVGPESQEIQP